jgi:hypothetical protein
MNTQPRRSAKASKEQLIYANLLLVGVWTGLAVLFVTYSVYLLGLLPAHVDLAVIPRVWGLGVAEYLEITHSPHGWGWLALLGKGDFINFIGFAFLGLMTVICFLVLFRGYWRKNDWPFAVISFCEIVVLCLAASGIFGGGGH